MAAPPQLTSLSVEQAAGLSKEQRELYEKLGGVLNPYLNDSVGALDRGLTFAENFKGQIRTFEFTMPSDPDDLRTAWTPVTFLNAWTNSGGSFQNVEYRRDAEGRVWFRGTMKRVATTYVVAFTLPAGFRPTAACRISPHVSAQTSGTTPSGVDVYASGDVAVFGYSASADISLDGCSVDTGTPSISTTVRSALAAPFPLTVTLDRTFPGTPRFHVQTLAEDITDTKAVTPVAGVSFSFTPTTSGGSPAVVVTDVQGCVPLRKYRITALFLPQ